MLAYKIKKAIEDHSELNLYVQKKFGTTMWSAFTRSHFNFIAQLINKKVSTRVCQNIFYIKNRLILGNDMYYTLCYKYKVETEEQLLEILKKQDIETNITWISGKALESYWKTSKPKEVKLNTLLVFLEIPYTEWDSWKYTKFDSVVEPNNDVHVRANKLMQNYVGSYFLYCPKTDHSAKVLKCPFIIKNDGEHIVAETITEGHRYKSDPIEKNEGYLKIVCRNLDWNETETHLFNIGLKTKPEIIFGVSVTLSVNMGTPIALNNILIYQSSDIGFLKDIEEIELDITNASNNEIDLAVLKYYERSSSKIIFSDYALKFEEFTKNNATLQ